MDAYAIAAARLKEYSKVRSMAEAIEFKKNLDAKLSLRDKREEAKLVFSNEGMTTDFKRVEKAIKSITETKKLI